MPDISLHERPLERSRPANVTLVGGTTLPERAAIVRTYCHEGSEVELRREPDDSACIGVWLACPILAGLLTPWKRIGEIPATTGDALLAPAAPGATLVARGTVRTVYAPVGRDEAVVAVEIRPPR